MRLSVKCLFAFVNCVCACLHLLGSGPHQCPQNEQSVMLRDFVENSLISLFPLRLVKKLNQHQWVEFQMDLLTAVEIKDCEMWQIFREASLVQFLCSAELPRISVNFFLKEFNLKRSGRFSPKSLTVLQFALTCVAAKATASYYYGDSQPNTLRLTGLSFPNLTRIAYQSVKLNYEDFFSLFHLDVLTKLEYFAQASFYASAMEYCRYD
ncbi:hypothetical protein SprV_0200988700 [Sparganum proliferum]